MQKFFLDLLRIPKKVEAVMEDIMRDVMADIEALPPWTGPGIGGTWVGGWRGAPGLLAPRHFDRFVWPYIVEMVRALTPPLRGEAAPQEPLGASRTPDLEGRDLEGRADRRGS